MNIASATIAARSNTANGTRSHQQTHPARGAFSFVQKADAH
jgi:hypothetical protein